MDIRDLQAMARRIEAVIRQLEPDHITPIGAMMIRDVLADELTSAVLEGDS